MRKEMKVRLIVPENFTKELLHDILDRGLENYGFYNVKDEIVNLIVEPVHNVSETTFVIEDLD